MSQALTTAHATLPPAVARKLRSLRARLRTWILVDGLARLLLVLVAVIAVDILVDWLFWLDWPQRLIVLAITALVLGLLAFRRLVRPLSTVPSDDALCLLVEEKHRQRLRQSLISALQFSRQQEQDYQRRGVSPGMVRATIAHGAQQAAGVEFGDVLDRRRFARNLTVLLLSLAILGGLAYGVTASPLLKTWFDRNVLLDPEVKWPQKTHLQVVGLHDGKVVLRRGAKWIQPVRVTDQTADEDVPEELWIELRSGRRGYEVMQRDTDDPRLFRFELDQVDEPLEFRVSGGDDRTPWYPVELHDPPQIGELRLHVVPPEYIASGSYRLPARAQRHTVLEGSQVMLTGESDQPLSGGEVTFGDRRLPLTVTAGERRFALTQSRDEVATGDYRVTVRSNREPLHLPSRGSLFTLEVQPDRSPRVRLRLAGIGRMITPRARLPLECDVADPVHCNLDDQFHVTKIWLAYNWHDQSPGAEVDSSGQFPRQSGTIEFPRLASALGSRRVEFRETVEVSRIGTLPVGSQLRFSILAKDNDTYDKDKPPGRSTEVILDVVSESTLRIDLQKREQLQAKLLAELIDSQQRALTDLRALAADVNGTDEVAPDDRRKLSSLFQQARAAQSLLVGVAARLEKIVIEAHNNRLEKEDGPLAERLRGKIVQPLEQLTAEQTPQLARLLQAARRNERHADPRDAALAQATDVQQAIVARLEEIRRHLILSPDFQDVLKQIIKIQEEQAKLRDATLKEKEDRILGKPDEAEEGKP